MNDLLNKKIPYRAIPISLESDPIWLSLSLKRRALFLFMVSKAVAQEKHSYKGIELTFGDYAWTYQTLADRFNETVCFDDQFSKTGCHKAIENFIEIGFVKVTKIGSGVRSLTVIRITHSETYELIKKERCTIKPLRCTTGERSDDCSGERSEDEEKPVDNISKDEIRKIENDRGERIKNIVNIGAVNDQQDLTESTIKTVFRKDNVMSMPSFKKEIDDAQDNVLKKFKLTAEQIENFHWLKDQKINSTDQTLSYWAKNYSLKRLKEVHKAAVKTKPQQGKTKSVGALMNHFLKKEIILETESRNENKEFMEAFRERCPEMQWKIEKKFVTCEINGITKEVFLDIHPHAFVDQLLLLEKQFKTGS